MAVSKTLHPFWRKNSAISARTKMSSSTTRAVRPSTGFAVNLLPRDLSGERPWKPIRSHLDQLLCRRSPLRATAAQGRTSCLSGFLVDGRLREVTQQGVGLFFFLQCFIEQADRVFQPHLTGPGFEGAIARHLVMLDRLRGS
jgi:hypothetical protein